MQVPTYITAGDSAQWLEPPVPIPGGAATSASHALTLTLRGSISGAALDLAGTPSEGGWAFALSAGQTGALNVGTGVELWYWAARLSAPGSTQTVCRGALKVGPNLSQTATFDGRSAAERVLATVEAAILARTTGDMVTEYTIGTRSLKKEPVTALLELRSKYRLIVARERKAAAIKAGLGDPSLIGIRFATR